MSCGVITNFSVNACEAFEALSKIQRDTFLAGIKGTRYAKPLRLLFKQHDIESVTYETQEQYTFYLVEIVTITYHDKIEGNFHSIEYDSRELKQ